MGIFVVYKRWNAEHVDRSKQELVERKYTHIFSTIPKHRKRHMKLTCEGLIQIQPAVHLSM